MHDTVRVLKAARINVAILVAQATIEGYKAENQIASAMGKGPIFDLREFARVGGDLEKQARAIMDSEQDY